MSKVYPQKISTKCNHILLFKNRGYRFSNMYRVRFINQYKILLIASKSLVNNGTFKIFPTHSVLCVCVCVIHIERFVLFFNFNFVDYNSFLLLLFAEVYVQYECSALYYGVTLFVGLLPGAPLTTPSLPDAPFTTPSEPNCRHSPAGLQFAYVILM